MEQISTDLRRKIASGIYFPFGHVRIEVRRTKHTCKSNVSLSFRSTCYRWYLFHSVPIGFHKEAEVNRTAQTRDSIIPDTVSQVAEWVCLSGCKKIPCDHRICFFVREKVNCDCELSKRLLLIFFTLPIRVRVDNGGPKEISIHSSLLIIKLLFFLYKFAVSLNIKAL